MTSKLPEAGAGFRCGAIALVGRPNVGKSTLLNALIGQKLSITSGKPQTTRHRIRGVLTTGETQFVFVDTPGYQNKHKSELNRVMNRNVHHALGEVDVAALVVEAGRYGPEDRALLQLMPKKVPLLLVVNKADRLDRAEMLKFLGEVGVEAEFAAIIPVSAQKRRNLPELLKVFRSYLPEQPPMFDSDDLTDRSERFLAAERIREKLFRLLGDEVPYGASVTIEKFEIEGRLRRIYASIVVDKDGHKAIVIGKGGETLKRVATGARIELEKLFDGKVYLEVWVKVRSGWADDAAALKRLGYE
jgi:GTP-binding protein Era